MKRYVVVLEIRTQDDEAEPWTWDWPTLLDMPDREDVHVLSCADITHAEDTITTKEIEA